MKYSLDLKNRDLFDKLDMYPQPTFKRIRKFFDEKSFDFISLNSYMPLERQNVGITNNILAKLIKDLPYGSEDPYLFYGWKMM